jgi:hypothetical protein
VHVVGQFEIREPRAEHFAPVPACYNLGMAHDDGPNHYYVRATHLTTGEQVALGSSPLRPQMPRPPSCE